MYIMFVDASGDPGPFKGGNTRFYVLSGLILLPEKWYEAYEGVLDIIRKFFPKIDLTKRPELHIHYLRHGKGIYGKLSRDDRRKMGVAIYDLIRDIDPTIISIVVDKEKYFSKYAHPDPVKHTSFQYLMDRYERFLSRRNSYGILVYDYEGKRDREGLQGAWRHRPRRGEDACEEKSDHAFHPAAHGAGRLLGA